MAASRWVLTGPLALAPGGVVTPAGVSVGVVMTTWLFYPLMSHWSSFSPTGLRWFTLNWDWLGDLFPQSRQVTMLFFFSPADGADVLLTVDNLSTVVTSVRLHVQGTAESLQTVILRDAMMGQITRDTSV